jgi:hypothetical protein
LDKEETIETAKTVTMRAEVAGLNVFVDAADAGFVDDGRGLVDPFDRATAVLRQQRQRRHRAALRPLRSDVRRLLAEPEVQPARLHPPPANRSRRRTSPPRSRDWLRRRGATPPTGDLYAIPGLENHRAAGKRAVNCHCLLMDDFSRRSWPHELLHNEDGKVLNSAALMPHGWTVERFKAVLLRQHPAPTPCLGAGWT